MRFNGTCTTRKWWPSPTRDAHEMPSGKNKKSTTCSVLKDTSVSAISRQRKRLTKPGTVPSGAVTRNPSLEIPYCVIWAGAHVVQTNSVKGKDMNGLYLKYGHAIYSGGFLFTINFGLQILSTINFYQNPSTKVVLAKWVRYKISSPRYELRLRPCICKGWSF